MLIDNHSSLEAVAVSRFQYGQKALLYRNQLGKEDGKNILLILGGQKISWGKIKVPIGAEFERRAALPSSPSHYVRAKRGG